MRYCHLSETNETARYKEFDSGRGFADGEIMRLACKLCKQDVLFETAQWLPYSVISVSERSDTV